MKLTHTGDCLGNLFPHDVSLPFVIPFGGNVTVLYTSDVAASFDDGSIRGFISAGYVTVEFVLGNEFQTAVGVGTQKVQLISGSSFTNYSTLTDALSASVSGDTVAFSPGVYSEEITIPAGVRVFGTGVGDQR